jgi:prefoldin subunit 5
MSQEMDELLATSQRLLAEMQALTERAKQLAEQHVEVAKAIKRRK